jgi:hypothetical protein
VHRPKEGQTRKERERDRKGGEERRDEKGWVEVEVEVKDCDNEGGGWISR